MRVCSLVFLALASTACTPGAAPAPAPASTTPDLSKDTSVGPKTNYSAAGLAPDTRAVALCEALHTLPVKRKAECLGAKSAGFMVTPMCVDTLTAALKVGKVQLEDAAIARCATAMAAATEDCGFARGFGTPLPAACDGLFSGSVPAGQACRSSMECEAGLQCFGVGPSDVGRCTAPAPTGSLCGSGVDALATYTRQTSVEKTRPACEGYCRLNRCQDFHARGAACQADLQCGPGASCQRGVCAEGVRTAGTAG